LTGPWGCGPFAAWLRSDLLSPLPSFIASRQPTKTLAIFLSRFFFNGLQKSEIRDLSADLWLRPRFWGGHRHQNPRFPKAPFPENPAAEHPKP